MIGLLGRCGPLSLLLTSFALMAGGLAAPSLPGLALASAALAVALPLLVGRNRFPAGRLVPGILAVASVAWSNWLLGSPPSAEAAAFAALRVGFFVVPGIVLASFIDPAQLGDHLGQRARLPSRAVLSTVAALQWFERLSGDWTELARTRRVRGLGPSRSPVSQVRAGLATAGALLVEALRGASTASVSMEGRGFSRPARTGVPRTWAEPAPWTRSDSVIVAIGLAAAILAIVGTALVSAAAQFSA